MRGVFFLLVIAAIVVYFISPTLSEFGEMERWSVLVVIATVVFFLTELLLKRKS